MPTGARIQVEAQALAGKFITTLLNWHWYALVQVQLFDLIRINDDGYDRHALHLFAQGLLAPYQSRMPDRPAPAPSDSLPPRTWAYEIDAGQFRHHLRRQGGWNWLLICKSGCRKWI